MCLSCTTKWESGNKYKKYKIATGEVQDGKINIGKNKIMPEIVVILGDTRINKGHGKQLEIWNKIVKIEQIYNSQPRNNAKIMMRKYQVKL